MVQTMVPLEDVIRSLRAAGMDSSNGPRLVAGLRDTPGMASQTPVSPYYTGPGGLFGVHGLERDLISTRIQPLGIAGAIPAQGTNIVNPRFPYFSSFSQATGNDPDGPCDDPATAGPGSSCIQTADFGRYEYQTRTLELNRLGQQQDRGQFMDLRFVNDPLLKSMGVIAQPDVPPTASVAMEVLMRFIEVGVAFQNKLARQIWTGNPSNNTAQGGYKEFPGLDILVGTTKVDAITGTPCPDLDSLITDFQMQMVNSGGPTGDIVRVMTYMMRMLRWNADQMGLAPAQWCIVMRPSLWWELTQVWPCSYITYLCTFPRGTVNGTPELLVSGDEQLKMRDDMRNGMYLLIDGIQYPVIMDTGLPEENHSNSGSITPGAFASDIFILPLSFANGMPGLYWEYYDFSAGPMEGVRQGMLGEQFWTDGGRYFWHRKPPVNFCTQWVSKIEPRLILHVPQLAARLLNVQYQPLMHERDPFPTDPYFVGGDQSTRTQPALYSDWNPTAGPGNI